MDHECDATRELAKRLLAERQREEWRRQFTKDCPHLSIQRWRHGIGPFPDGAWRCLDCRQEFVPLLPGVLERDVSQNRDAAPGNQESTASAD